MQESEINGYTALAPLEDRIYAAVKDLPVFNFKQVRSLFGNESDRVLYRSLNKLEEQRRIRFVGHSGRTKTYSALGQSMLPTLQTKDGDYVPLSQMMLAIAGNYDEQGRWKTLEDINKLPIILSRLFVVADIKDEKEQRLAYYEVIKDLNQMGSVLRVITGYIDSVVKHPTMSGDLKHFNEVFNGNDSALPTPEQMTAFKLWYSRNFGSKGVVNNASTEM